MFSDQHRILKLTLIILTLIGFSLSVQFGKPGLTYRQCLSDPETFDGKEIPIYIDARIIRIEPTRLIISQPEGPVAVRVPGGTGWIKGKPGDYLEALVVFHREGYLELKAIQTAPLRKIKIAVSILPVLVVAALLIRTVRWEKGRLVMKGYARLREDTKGYAKIRKVT